MPGLANVWFTPLRLSDHATGLGLYDVAILPLRPMPAAAIGTVAWVDNEDLIDPVTAVSGGGPAYVFLLAELLEKAGIEQGLPAELARMLARQTVSGSGALLAASNEESDALRRAVTSPRGTTERALAVLMADGAWPVLVSRAISDATARSRELAD